tara:strand:- start:2725 stop:2952 length:228 start_codon:yes stop_codon:yes gene_type:complete
MTIKTRLARLERQHRADGDIINIYWYESKEDAVERYKAEHGLTAERFDLLGETGLVVYLQMFSRPKGNGAAVSGA